MISSMTGFGKGVNESAVAVYTVEIKSVNNRYVDINIKLPRDYIKFEDRIKKVIQSKVKRGKIDVFVTVKNKSDETIQVEYDESLAGKYFDALKTAAEKFDVPYHVSSSDMFRMPDVFSVNSKDIEPEDLWLGLEPAVIMAVDNLAKMRLVEGENMKTVLTDLTDGVESRFKKIIERAPEVPQIYAKKLKERIAALMDADVPADPQRLATEIALYADHCSIDEEIARFLSHISQMRTLLAADEPVGRKMDFLVQELNREINTCGSKAQDGEIAQCVIEIKSEIEKIREQIQNIE